MKNLIIMIFVLILITCSKPQQLEKKSTDNNANNLNANPCIQQNDANSSNSSETTNNNSLQNNTNQDDYVNYRLSENNSAVQNCDNSQTSITNNSSNDQTSTTDINKTDINNNDLLNPTEKAQCDNQKLVYDRANKKCFNATLDMSWCTKDAIIQKFKNFNVDISTFEQKLNSYLNDGYVIDQCGIKSQTSYPLITLYKQIDNGTIKTKTFEIND